MAISKWISFGNAPSTSAPAAPPTPEVVPVATAADEKHFGLENFGNTCYANSVLQALYFCGPFRDLIVQYPDPSTPDALLPPPTILIPPSISSPPPTHVRPKSSRKASISENMFSHGPSQAQTPPNPCTPTITPIPTSPPTLLSALRSLYIHISRNPADKGTVAPRAFIDKLKELNELFRSTMHQDAHEFLNYLLNQIVEEIDEDRKKANGHGNGSAHTNPSGEERALVLPFDVDPLNTTLVHRLFEGVLTSETRCLTCETVSSRDESFLDLSIDIEQNSSVTACLRQFSASEMLCQKNKFFCDSCCDLQEAEKRMKIKKLPNILALHLKRFKYQEDLERYIKLTYRVAFPFELRLFNTVDDAENPDRLYELFAIVVHIGNGPHHGHYVSVVKTRGTWYLFDDDTVEPMKESEIPKYFGESNAGSAYVLYYQAVDLDLSALGLHPVAVPSSVGHLAESTIVSQSTSIASTTEGTDHEPSSPAIPPGLTEPAMSQPSPSPSSPAFNNNPFVNSVPPPATPSVPPLRIDIPPNGATPAPVSPVTPGGSSRGLLGSLGLRHSPSLRIKSSASNSSSNPRNSVVDVPPVPPLPAVPNHLRDSSGASELGERTSSPPLSSSPSMPRSPRLNGKEKEREKEKDRDKEKSSSGTWFKRKSIRSDKPPSSMSPSLAERSSSLGAGAEDASTPWYKSSKRIMRRASEAGLVDRPANGAVQSPVLNNAEIPRTTSMSPVLHPVPENKNATPKVALIGKSEGKASRHRPSTAGASVGRPSSVVSPPMPPLPLSPMSTLSEGRVPTPNNAKEPNGNHSWHHHSHSHSHTKSQPRPHTSYAPASPSALGFSASNGTSSTLSTSAGDSSHVGSATPAPAPKPKRSGRKLSLTAPMLGFGRRDKDKDRRPSTPTAQYTALKDR
ncbi:hypothetical protein EIP86_002068 [Pleurotus ostreatoroseus]|nr:hypothetical protein EIP86_002068 [Pleurotus ostreatoroseus]